MTTSCFTQDVLLHSGVLHAESSCRDALHAESPVIKERLVALLDSLAIARGMLTEARNDYPLNIRDLMLCPSHNGTALTEEGIFYPSLLHAFVAWMSVPAERVHVAEKSIDDVLALVRRSVLRPDGVEDRIRLLRKLIMVLLKCNPSARSRLMSSENNHLEDGMSETLGLPAGTLSKELQRIRDARLYRKRPRGAG